MTYSASCTASTSTETLCTSQPTCSSNAGGDDVFSRGAIAGAAIGSFCGGLIAFGSVMLISRCRKGGTRQEMQTTVIRGDERQRYLDGGPLPELPANRSSRGAELP